MAVNNDGHLLDSAGNVVVDFVWGNMPMQPNDIRTTKLDPTLDSHNIATSGWNGYPLYLPNDPGEGAGYILVPSVIGQTIALATDALQDATLVVTVASANTPAVSSAALTSNVVTLLTSAAHGYAVGQSVVIAGLDDVAGTSAITAISNDGTTVTYTATNTYVPGDIVTITGASSGAYNLVGAVVATASGSQFTVTDPATGTTSTASASFTTLRDYSALNGTYTLTTGTTASTLKYAKTHANLPANTTDAVVGVTAKVLAKAGLIKTQSIAAGANSIAAGSAITITPYFAS